EQSHFAFRSRDRAHELLARLWRDRSVLGVRHKEVETRVRQQLGHVWRWYFHDYADDRLFRPELVAQTPASVRLSHGYRRVPLVSRSSVMAPIIRTPMVICCQNVETLRRSRPFVIVPIKRIPMAVPATDPTPPKSDAPPMTMAAMALSRSAVPKLPAPASRRAARIKPASVAQRPLIMKAASLTRPGRTPESRAASVLPPTA